MVNQCLYVIFVMKALTEEEIANHIRDEHESIMNDDLNISDTELYEGFDEDGNRIVQDDIL